MNNLNQTNRRTKYKNNPMNAVTENATKSSSSDTMDYDELYNVQFDIFSLNLYIAMVINSDTYVTKTDLTNLYTLMERVNIDRFKNDPEKYTKLKIIRIGIEARITHAITNKYVLVDYIYRHIPAHDFNMERETLLNIPHLSPAELEQVATDISNKLRLIYLVKDSEQVLSFSTSLVSGDYRDPENTITEFTTCLEDLLVKLRRAKRQATDIITFSLEEEALKNIVYETHTVVNSPSNRLKTGMSPLNTMLNGGFENTRVHMFFGIAGGGKSILLLNLAMQLKKYNLDYVCKDPSKRPAVVLIIQENTVTETVERLFAMCATDMYGMTVRSKEECLNIIKKSGMLLSSESPIDLIIRYVPNSSVNTNYLYDLYDELSENGIETIAVIHDYIKCIKAADTRANNDPRIELGYITKEYKKFTNEKMIPLIGASQLNRESIRSVDEAIKAEREDRFKDISSTHIGESMLIFENIDFAAIIGAEDYSNTIDFESTPDMVKSDDEVVRIDKGKYLCFKKIKSRGLSSSFEYFVIPFDPYNRARLMEDVKGDYNGMFFCVADAKEHFCQMMETGSYAKLLDSRNKEPIVNTIKYRIEDEERVIKGDYTNAYNMVMSRLYRGYTSSRESSTRREYGNVYVKFKSENRLQAINKDHTKVDFILGTEDLDMVESIADKGDCRKMDTSDYTIDHDFDTNEPLLPYHAYLKEKRAKELKEIYKIEDAKEREMRLNLPKHKSRKWHLYYLQHRAMMQNTYMYNPVRFTLPYEKQYGVDQYSEESVCIQDYAVHANCLVNALVADINNGTLSYDKAIKPNNIPDRSKEWFEQMPVMINEPREDNYDPLSRFMHEYTIPGNTPVTKEYFAVMPTHQQFYMLHDKLHRYLGGNIYLLTPYEREAYNLYRCRDLVENMERTKQFNQRQQDNDLTNYTDAQYYLYYNICRLTAEDMYDSQFYTSFIASAYTNNYTDFIPRDRNLNKDLFADPSSKRIMAKEMPSCLIPRNKEVIVNKLQDECHAEIKAYSKLC